VLQKDVFTQGGAMHGKKEAMVSKNLSPDVKLLTLSLRYNVNIKI
jgi:hypothetical protein